MKRSDVKLTKRLIDSFRFEGAHPKAQDIRWDSEDVGFGVRVYPSGRKAYVVSYRDDEGRKHIINVKAPEDSGTLTLEQARTRARALLADVGTAKDLKRKGVKEALPLTRANPAEARKHREPASKTVSDLVDAFLKQHAEAKRRPTTAKEYRRQLETHIKPRWGSRLAKSIKRADVAELHTELGARAPTQANRTLAVLSKMFSFGRVKGFLPDDAPNPCQGIERFEEHKRDVWVKAEELPKVAAAIDAEPNVYLRAYFWTLLFTGMRRTEARTLRWADVDLEADAIRLEQEHTKAHRAHVIPLSAPAKALLSALPRLAGNPYVFPSLLKAKQPVGDVNKAWERIRARAGLPGVHVHDLRRSLGSWLASYGGANLPLIGAILNHTSPQTTQVYARLAEDPRRQALEEHAKRVQDAAQGLRLVKGAG